MLRNLLSALTFLHRHGVAHRVISPDGVWKRQSAEFLRSLIPLRRAFEDVKSENILWAQGQVRVSPVVRGSMCNL